MTTTRLLIDSNTNEPIGYATPDECRESDAERTGTGHIHARGRTCYVEADDLDAPAAVDWTGLPDVDGELAHPTAVLALDRVRLLRVEAGAAGDLDMVTICDAALEGDAEALAECARVVRSAEALA